MSPIELHRSEKSSQDEMAALNANAIIKRYSQDPALAEMEKQNRQLVAALKILADPANYTINSRNEIRWTRTDSSQYTPWGYARSILDGEK